MKQKAKGTLNHIGLERRILEMSPEKGIQCSEVLEEQRTETFLKESSKKSITRDKRGQSKHVEDSVLLI